MGGLSRGVFGINWSRQRCQDEGGDRQKRPISLSSPPITTKVACSKIYRNLSKVSFQLMVGYQFERWMEILSLHIMSGQWFPSAFAAKKRH